MKKIIKKLHCLSSIRLAFAPAIIAFSFLAISAQAKITVQVSPETTIEGDRIELGKIAVISGASEKAERLKSVSLGYSPNIGMMREVNRDSLNLAIAAAGFSPGEILVQAPTKIIVRRASQIIGEAVVREAVEKAVFAELKSDGVKIDIIRLDLPRRIEVPVGSLAVRATPANARNLFSSFTVSLEIQVDNRVVERVPITTQIEAFADILVAAKNLTSTDKLSAADFTVENRRLEKPITNYLLDAKKLRGVKLLKDIPAGTMLSTDAVIAATVIKTGDIVKIEAQSGSLKIIIKGEARTNGRIGDRISVKNSESGALLQAIVIDETTVRINY